MIDLDTFLTELYVMADDFCKDHFRSEPVRPGRPAGLIPSEVVTLAVFSQWYRFRGQRDFYRFAHQRLRPLFPTLPNRAQFNRLVRNCQPVLVSFFLHLAVRLEARRTVYEILDTTGVPVRNLKRRGHGWLEGLANVGHCTRLGWFNGFRLLISINPLGAITGFGFGAGSAKEQPLAETFFALRRHPQPGFLSVGQPALGYYLGDAGFAGEPNHRRWKTCFGARMVCEPQANSSKPWPKPWRRWLHSLREIVEAVFDKLIHFFRLEDDRPHDLCGFQANLVAKMTLHNFCIWLNQQFNRPPLAFADPLGW